MVVLGEGLFLMSEVSLYLASGNWIPLWGMVVTSVSPGPDHVHREHPPPQSHRETPGKFDSFPTDLGRSYLIP